MVVADCRNSAGAVQDSLQRGQRQVQQVKLRLGLQIDDKQFQQMINDSGVCVALVPSLVCLICARNVIRGAGWLTGNRSF
jgi:hypothetical protein